ncbi:hypothetical protein F4819DRAFT_194360 [Hypoxylon fuscum]|nr:hypothetical protein F4819DRAFT_194360 [Hypoxylon fuscum]
MEYPSTREIKRKPVPSAKAQPSPPDDSNILDDLLDDYLESPNSHHDHVFPTQTKDLKINNRPHAPQRLLSAPLVPSPHQDHALSTELKGLRLDSHSPTPLRQLSVPVVSVPVVSSPSEISLSPSATTSVTSNSNSNSNRSIWKTAFDETIYFAGGLVSHPFESTKHYSILRHSAAVILYRGPSTSVAVTVFADGPLPADRSFWLQRKGFSGNMGMAASALLRTQGNWIDVTPSFEALPSDLPESDERAWQRDIKKFTKKTASQKNLAMQTVRETCVIRIPALAEDGYLRIVMCTGEGSKKTLCPSPVFRVASTSSDVSVLRGASLSTMPIELGLKVASVVGQNVVDRYVGPARDIIQSQVEKVQDRIDQYKPGLVAREAGVMAYEKSKVGERVVILEESFDAERDVTYDVFQTEGILGSPPQIVGADSGPEKPYPIRFTGKVVEGTGRGRAETGIPTANLSGVPNDLLLRLNGIYIGWAAVQPAKGIEDISNDWLEAIITVGPSPYAAPRIVAKNVATVHIIHDFGAGTFFNANLKVVIMAYLRPVPKPDRSQPTTAITADIAKDINIALASLSRENWHCEKTLRRVKTEMSARSIEERYVDMRAQVQKRVDSVPLHLAGVRTARGELIDQAHGRGGLYIRR